MPRIGKKTIERLETSLEDELHRRADAGALTAEDLQGLDAELFAPAVYDESAAERGGYSNYSYWGSTLRIFWRNRVARCLVILLIALLAFTFIQPYLPNQKDPNVIYYDETTGMPWPTSSPARRRALFWGPTR